jgi:hypothetical protein
MKLATAQAIFGQFEEDGWGQGDGKQSPATGACLSMAIGIGAYAEAEAWAQESQDGTGMTPGEVLAAAERSIQQDVLDSAARLFPGLGKTVTMEYEPGTSSLTPRVVALNDDPQATEAKIWAIVAGAITETAQGAVTAQ